MQTTYNIIKQEIKKHPKQILPEVSQLSVLEYSPIAEILGMNGAANLAMNSSNGSSK